MCTFSGEHTRQKFEQVVPNFRVLFCYKTAGNTYNAQKDGGAYSEHPGYELYKFIRMFVYHMTPIFTNVPFFVEVLMGGIKIYI